MSAISSLCFVPSEGASCLASVEGPLVSQQEDIAARIPEILNVIASPEQNIELIYSNWGGRTSQLSRLIDIALEIFKNYQNFENYQDQLQDQLNSNQCAINEWNLIAQQISCYLEQNPNHVDETLCFGMTSLHKAAEKGCLDLVFLLLSHRANTQIENCFGQTAAERASAFGHHAIARYISNYEFLQQPIKALQSSSLG